jgi:uncharacterized protein (TIGR00255 family)
MTGFGSAINNNIIIEIRSLNHRFIDIAIKMPPYMSKYEINLRNIIKERFHRGRFDVSIYFINHSIPQLKINRTLAKNIYSALLDLQKELSIPGDITIDTLTGYREIFNEEEPQYDIEALYATFNEALSHLEIMRIQEGRLLADDIRKRVCYLIEMNNQIKMHAPHEVVRWRKKFTERLRLILEAGMVDNNKIIQEAAIMAEKLDISEEISRIENHLKQLKQFIEILNKDNSIGKKLDFILQEINREVNTLAYKTGDYNISNLVVEMKTEIEKIREQVQNIQ